MTSATPRTHFAGTKCTPKTNRQGLKKEWGSEKCPHPTTSQRLSHTACHLDIQ